ncbi:MAG: hypothetical protein HUK15_04145 [Bacteroidales bacterium]|nr:hypothetical protein [Bacteroidales bacterium]
MRSLLSILLVFMGLCCFSQNKSVLFVGNSYTQCNGGLEKMFASLAASKGYVVETEAAAVGGFSLKKHCNRPETIEKINSRLWDYVVLQELSLNPCYPPEAVDTLTYPYAKILSDLVHDNSICTNLVFYMTWGRKNGYTYDTTYMPLCTFDGMQERLCESYCEMANDNNGIVAPVGMAFKFTKDYFPDINLYVEDNSHPSAEGTYLAACVFYATIFKETPIGASYIYTLTPETAYTLQSVADEVVFGKYKKWRLNENAECMVLNETKRSLPNFNNLVSDGRIVFRIPLVADYNIYDTKGVLQKQGKIAGFEIEVSYLKPGMYFLVLNNESIFKFIVY